MNLTIRAMHEADLPVASEISRKSFSAQLKLPENLLRSSEALSARYRINPAGGLVAVLDEQLVGSSFATRLGSLALFGPLTVRPTGWTGGAGGKLSQRVLELAAEWGCAHVGGFTFSDSPQHAESYRRLDIWPRALVSILGKLVPPQPPKEPVTLRRFSELDDAARHQALESFRAITDGHLAGLDLTQEVAQARQLGLGDTVFVEDASGVAAFALCHAGPNVGSPPDVCDVKFAAARRGAEEPRRFQLLLAALEPHAKGAALKRIQLTMSFARTAAYKLCVEKGYLATSQGVACSLRAEPLMELSDQFISHDWRP